MKVKRKNFSWLGSCQTEVPMVMFTKFPALVMVLRVVSNEIDFHFPASVGEVGLASYLA
jgi:hypothetical protein